MVVQTSNRYGGERKDGGGRSATWLFLDAQYIWRTVQEPMYTFTRKKGYPALFGCSPAKLMVHTIHIMFHDNWVNISDHCLFTQTIVYLI